jgi:hypothetical protein
MINVFSVLMVIKYLIGYIMFDLHLSIYTEKSFVMEVTPVGMALIYWDIKNSL